jgi:hypothetical protein
MPLPDSPQCLSMIGTTRAHTVTDITSSDNPMVVRRLWCFDPRCRELYPIGLEQHLMPYLPGRNAWRSGEKTRISALRPQRRSAPQCSHHDGVIAAAARRP